MVNKLIVTAAAILMVAGFATAEEFDAIVDDWARNAMVRAKSTETLFYHRIWLDSKGTIVHSVFQWSPVTKDTKVATGTFDEKQKEWVAGKAIEGGVGADLFKNRGKTLRVRLDLGDGAAIRQILVTNPDAKLERVTGYYAILKERGRTWVNGRGTISFAPVELDEKGRVINTFPQTSSVVFKDTQVALGTYNEKVETWEAGDEIPNGVWGEPFKELGAKNIYVRITFRADGQGIAQVLAVRPTSVAPGGAKGDTVRPRQPGGLLGDQLGTYVTIEGVPAEGPKVETGTLLVDTVDGKKLDKPIPLLIHNLHRLPSGQRYVLKGYESGAMIGRPPAEYAAAREQGQDAEALVKQDATGWRWRPYFVVLIAVEPKGLEVRKP